MQRLDAQSTDQPAIGRPAFSTLYFGPEFFRLAFSTPAVLVPHSAFPRFRSTHAENVRVARLTKGEDDASKAQKTRRDAEGVDGVGFGVPLRGLEERRKIPRGPERCSEGANDLSTYYCCRIAWL